MSQNQNESSILVDSAGSRVTVTLNRAPANALDVATSRLLYSTMWELSQDHNVKVILIQSASPKIFCAGADVSTVEAHDVALMDHLGKTLKDTFLLMRSMGPIIVAAVNGHCLGGGLELALAADFRLASDGPAKWGLPEINLGLFPGGGAVAMMSRLIGSQKAFFMALSGQPISVGEAYAWGLADELIAQKEFSERVEQFVTSINDAPAVPIKALKQAVWRGQEMTLAGAFDFERVMHGPLVQTPDCFEGVDAFRERRQAQFGQGRMGE